MRFPAATLFLAPLLMAATSAMAQDAPRQAPVGLNVFFSPAGQPFRAKGSEPYPITIWFNQADSDKDGKISHEEFLLDSMAFFIALDRNKDTFVNSPENSRYETELAPEITRVDPRIGQPKLRVNRPDPESGQPQDPTGGRYVKLVQGASQYSLIDEPQPVRAADSNLDFKVSDAEWVAASEQRFSILDINGDGNLTADELSKTPAQVAGQAALQMPADGGRKKKRLFGGGGR